MIFENCGEKDRPGDRGKFKNNAYLNSLKYAFNLSEIYEHSYINSFEIRVVFLMITVHLLKFLPNAL